jgi:hypothetical protein
MAADDTRFQRDVDNPNPRSPEEFKKDPQSRVSDSFDRAKNSQQPLDQQKQNVQGQGSQQIANSAPGMNGPKPPENARNAVDRQAHNNAMSKDDQAAKEARARELKDSINKNKDQEQQRNKEQEQQR